MSRKIESTALQVAGVAALYVGLYHLSGLITENEQISSVASIFFLPAFVRLLAFLIIGFWSIPALFIAALLCLDLGLDFADRVIVSGFLALGAPLGIAAVSQLIGLEPSLESLTPRQLLLLSIGSALGSSGLYNLGLIVVGFEQYDFFTQLVTFVGDITGTWALIYLIKILLTIYGRTLRSD